MINVESLSYKYPNNQAETLNNLSFEIKQGEIFGFLGPSGSGKSTTQKILFNLISGYTGKVFFDNRPLPEWGREFYDRIGVSFELPNHYLKLTGIENLRFFGSFYKNFSEERMDNLLKRLGLIGDSDKRVSDYSKGMKMRLNFARALMHDPDILFLDEPTSGLDPLNAKIIKNIILELKNKGKTIFITTHNMIDADQLCDKVAFLHKGEIKALDEPNLLKIKHGQRKVRVLVKGSAEESIYEMDNLGNNQEFLNFLQQNMLETIHSEEATLEEVFIKLTGEQLV